MLCIVLVKGIEEIATMSGPIPQTGARRRAAAATSPEHSPVLSLPRAPNCLLYAVGECLDQTAFIVGLTPDQNAGIGHE